MNFRNDSPAKILSPALVVFLVMVAVILSSWLIPFFRRHVIGEVRANVSLDTEQQEKAEVKTAGSANRTAPIQAILNGEVYRTAERMKEIEALAAITTLYLATETMNHRQPRTVESLLSGMQNTNLISPKLWVSNNQPDTLSSINSIIYLRYRPAPLGVEIVSLGHVRMDGPGLIVRVPGDIGDGGDGGNGRDASNSGDEASSSSMYVATSLNDVRIPESFSSKAELIASGWASEPTRKSMLSNNEKTQLMSWALEQRQQEAPKTQPK